jgi:rod shape-determining protein MreD
LLLLPIVYAAAVLETSLTDAIRVGYVTPDLLALVAVIWILVTTGRRTFLVAGAIGLAADLISPGRLGAGMASFLLVGYGLTRLRTKLELEHLLWQVPLVGVSTTVLAAGQAMGSWLLGETAVPLTTLLVRALGVGVYTTGVAVPLLMVIGWVREPYRVRRKKLAGF